MKVITSKENKIYKHCHSLTSKKYRDKLGLYILEGEKLVKEAYEMGMAETIICDVDYSKGIYYQGVDVVFMVGKLFERLAQTENSQGILAIVKKRKYSIDEFINIADNGSANVVVLDRLQDPGNIGTIIRTAEASCYVGIISIKGTGDIYSPKAVRSSAGSILRIPILFVDGEKEAIDVLRKSKKNIVGTAFETDKYYYDVEINKNTGLIIGNEGNGMSQYLIENTDVNVKIPMKETVDSLNAAVAAGILMYQSKGGREKKHGK